MTTSLKVPEGQALPAEIVAQAAAAARACRLVAFPTETGYAIGSNGLVKAAARKIYHAKERSSLKPLPALVRSVSHAKCFVEWTPLAQALAQRFWPGPLVLVLKPTAEGRLLTFPEYQTVAVRVPAHPAAHSLVQATDFPWLYSSANKAGTALLADGAAVAAAFAGKADVIIDAGSVPAAEATLVDATGAAPRVLREGAISVVQIQEAK